MDRRLDEWIDKSRIVEEEGEYITTLTPADKSKTLTRSQRRFQEEFHHLQKSYDDMDATTAKLEREHEEVRSANLYTILWIIYLVSKIIYRTFIKYA